MFCGWQIVNDFNELNELSSGCLEIDVKTGVCLFNGKVNSKLTMPLVLNDWFSSDLNEHGISKKEISIARLTVDFNMHDFGKKNSSTPEFHCSSKLVSGENTYTLEYKGEHAENKLSIT